MVLKDLNHFSLRTQGTIYGMTTFKYSDKTSMVLAILRDSDILQIYYANFKLQTKKIEFAYIPKGSRMIAIGSLKRGSNDFVIGITHSSLEWPEYKKIPYARRIQTDYEKLFYLNLYASESREIDQLAQSCQTIQLDYCPYHLFSTDVIQLKTVDDLSKPVITKVPIWLLSGGDRRLHVYVADGPNQSFNEKSIQDYLPELVSQPIEEQTEEHAEGQTKEKTEEQADTIVLWIDVINIDRSTSDEIIFERLVALGDENGSVRLLHSVITEGDTNCRLIRESRFDFGTTTLTTQVRFFRVNSKNLEQSVLRKQAQRETQVMPL